MAAAAHELIETGAYVWTPNDEHLVRHFRVTGETDPHDASTVPGISYGDVHPDDADCYARELYANMVPGAYDTCDVLIHYFAHTRATRRVVGQTEDEYISETLQEEISFDLLSTDPTAADLQGIQRSKGRLAWHRTQWRSNSNHADAEPLLWTRNDDTFTGWAAGYLLLVDFTCRELGKDFWQADYWFRVDSRDSHGYKFFWRLPSTGLKDTDSGEQTSAIYALAEWDALFTDP